MNQPELVETGPANTAPAQPESAGIDPVQPYLSLKPRPTSSLAENRRLVAIGAGVAVVILWMAFSVLSHKSAEVAHDRAAKHPASAPQAGSDSALPSSLSPIMGAERSSFEESPGTSVRAEQLVRGADAQRDRSPSSHLGSLPMPWLEDRRPPQSRSDVASIAAL